MQSKLATGWNTWDTRSVLSHVLLPYGVAIDLNLINEDNERINTFRIGERYTDAPVMRPGPHTYDGYYTDISLEWKGNKLRVQSAAEGLKCVILITPLDNNYTGGHLIVAPKTLWYRYNGVAVEGNHFSFNPGGTDLKIDGIVTGDFKEEKNHEIFLSADKPVLICCQEKMTQTEAEEFIRSHADNIEEESREKYGEYYDVYNAMQSVLSWNNIYDPSIRKVVTPISRSWSVGRSANPSLGGFSLFCWDTYFASIMLSVGNKELAYANAVEMTNGITESGFIPNFHQDNDFKSRDRSQPPVGSLAVWNIYKKYKEKWFLECVYDNLLAWNRWWNNNRNVDGLLCWGSTPYEKKTYRRSEWVNVNTTVGGALESGLDNSHMFDGVLFDKEKHVQMQNDVGLSGLYIMDCKILAKIAGEMGHTEDASELRERAMHYGKNLNKLWDEKRGFYYNRRTDSGELNRRISPSNFYSMLASTPTQKQAERMIKEHFFNPEEFWGEWIIPSTPHNDAAFNDNNYWRGRIWAPMNFLVYIGLCNYNFPEARRVLSEKSKELLLKSWLSDGYVFENYNASTGIGDDVTNSDKFYHWGALLGFITLIEEGYYQIEL